MLILQRVINMKVRHFRPPQQPLAAKQWLQQKCSAIFCIYDWLRTGSTANWLVWTDIPLVLTLKPIAYDDVGDQLWEEANSQTDWVPSVKLRISYQCALQHLFYRCLNAIQRWPDYNLLKSSDTNSSHRFNGQNRDTGLTNTHKL